MIDLPKDSHSLSDFKRKTNQYMARMKRSGHPLVLTVHGKAALVVHDAAGYQRLLELIERSEMEKFLDESRTDINQGRTQPARAALERLARKHNLHRKGK